MSTMPELHDAVVVISMSDKEAFEKRLQSLNLKAEKFGLPPISVGPPQRVRYYREETILKDGDLQLNTWLRFREGAQVTKDTRFASMLHIPLIYPMVKLGDWQVIGSIDAVAPGENVVFAATSRAEDKAQLEQHRACPIGCEHCNTARQRKTSYLLRSDAGEFKEVGSTCLEDFTGIDPGKALFLAKLHEFVSYYQDEEDGGFRNVRSTSIPTREFLARVAYLSETPGGFISSKKAMMEGCEPSYQTAGRSDAAFATQEYLDRRDACLELADRVIAHYTSLEEPSEFDANVKTLLKQSDLALENKHLAFAAASVPGYQRELTFQKRRQEDLTKAHVGTQGDRMDGVLSVERVMSFNNRFGTKYKLLMNDPEGNRVIWDTQRPPQELLEHEAIGKPFVATYTVDGHVDYKGAPQTVIKRMAFKAWGAELPSPEQLETAAKARRAKPKGEPKPAKGKAVPDHLSLMMTVEKPISEAFRTVGWGNQLGMLMIQAADGLRAGKTLPLALTDVNGVPVATLARPTSKDFMASVENRVFVNSEAHDTVEEAMANMASVLERNAPVVATTVEQRLATAEAPQVRIVNGFQSPEGRAEGRMGLAIPLRALQAENAPEIDPDLPTRDAMGY